mmetsp:Transcript_14552/g.46620  ORF Transcript_14552/g.46620 Transcript_14552/m.46620 type:complete len:303 (+) Transcript_14552:1720-2628(+)
MHARKYANLPAGLSRPRRHHPRPQTSASSPVVHLRARCPPSAAANPRPRLSPRPQQTGPGPAPRPPRHCRVHPGQLRLLHRPRGPRPPDPARNWRAPLQPPRERGPGRARTPWSRLCRWAQRQRRRPAPPPLPPPRLRPPDPPGPRGTPQRRPPGRRKHAGPGGYGRTGRQPPPPAGPSWPRPHQVLCPPPPRPPGAAEAAPLPHPCCHCAPAGQPGTAPGSSPRPPRGVLPAGPRQRPPPTIRQRAGQRRGRRCCWRWRPRRRCVQAAPEGGWRLPPPGRRTPEVPPGTRPHQHQSPPQGP